MNATEVMTSLVSLEKYFDIIFQNERSVPKIQKKIYQSMIDRFPDLMKGISEDEFCTVGVKPNGSPEYNYDDRFLEALLEKYPELLI